MDGQICRQADTQITVQIDRQIHFTPYEIFRHRNRSIIIIYYYLSCEATHCLLQILIQAAFSKFLLCKRPWERHVEYAKMSNTLVMSPLESSSYCCKHVGIHTRLCRGKEVAEMGKSKTIVDCSLFLWCLTSSMMNDTHFILICP